jgi:hypothetical protein
MAKKASKKDDETADAAPQPQAFDHDDMPRGATVVHDEPPDVDEDPDRFNQNLYYGELKALNHGEDPPPIDMSRFDDLARAAEPPMGVEPEEEGEAEAAARGRQEMLGDGRLRVGAPGGFLRSLAPPRHETVAAGGGAPLSAQTRSTVDPIEPLLSTARVLLLQADALQLLARQLLRDVEALD